MKKLTCTTAIFIAMAATSVFAHHPSLDVNPNYEMVDDQLEAVESPHWDMDLDAMGANTATTTGESDSAMAEMTQDSVGGVTTAREQAASQTGDGPGVDAAADAGTIDLMENVAQ